MHGLVNRAKVSFTFAFQLAAFFHNERDCEIFNEPFFVQHSSDGMH